MWEVCAIVTDVAVSLKMEKYEEEVFQKELAKFDPHERFAFMKARSEAKDRERKERTEERRHREIVDALKALSEVVEEDSSSSTECMTSAILGFAVGDIFGSNS